MSIYEVATKAAELADDERAEDIVILDMKDVTLVADYFVICTGRSTIHTKAIAKGIEEGLDELGVNGLRKEGIQDSSWILLDYGGVVIHVFIDETRKYYDLERLWADAKKA